MPEQELEKSNAAPVKRSLISVLADKSEMSQELFLSTIKNTVMPKNASKEEVAAFLMVAKEYDMNPILREIHAFPKKGGGITPVVGVDGWAKMITRNPDFDGVEFEYENQEGKPVSTTCILYKKSCTRPTKITELYSECYRKTEPWNNMPHRMLRHKALMQCGRVAFGISGITDEDEARDIREVEAIVVEDDPLTPGRHTRKKNNPETLPAPAEEHNTLPDDEPNDAPAEPKEPSVDAPEDAPAKDVDAEVVEEEKIQPRGWGVLSRGYDSGKGDLVDQCLADVGLASFFKLDWKTLSKEHALLIARASAKYNVRAGN